MEPEVDPADEPDRLLVRSTGWIAFPSTLRTSAPIVSPMPWWSPGSISADVAGSRNSLVSAKSALDSERLTRPSVIVVTLSAGTYFGFASAERRDRKAVEDVRVVVAGDLVDRADLGAVGGVDLPAGPDHQPGDGVAHAGDLARTRPKVDEYPQGAC